MKDLILNIYSRESIEGGKEYYLELNVGVQYMNFEYTAETTEEIEWYANQTKHALLAFNPSGTVTIAKHI